MVAAGIAFHLWQALKRAFTRVAFWFGLMGAISAILAELVGIFSAGGQLPTLENNLIALALGLAVGWSAGMTVLAGEILRSLLSIVKDVGRNLEHGMEEGGKVGGALVQGIERLERRL
ncbi:MAG TPA: hypothetical protein VFY89_02745 [Ktedonobacterales bacterium]